MIVTRPEIGFERLLVALGQNLIDMSDEELLAMVNELGIKPGMKGSIALYGVTFAVRVKTHHEQAVSRGKKLSITPATVRGRRRPKADTPSSS